MGRTATPSIDKIKSAILNDCTVEEQVKLAEWFEMILEVREADAAAAKRRAATAQEVKP